MAEAAMARMVVIQTEYRKGEMKELDGSFFPYFKAVEVDKPLVLFTGSF